MLNERLPSTRSTEATGRWGLPILILSAFGAACAAGPDFVRPEPPVAPSWTDRTYGESQVVRGEPANYGSWWRALEDPALDLLVEKAYGQNLTLQGAAVRILEARAGLALAVGRQFPQRQGVGADAAAVKLSDNAPNAALLDRTFFDFQLGFDAEWELDVWGRFGRVVEAAYADYLSAVVGYDAALVTVTGEVARTYVLSRTFEERLALARENIAIQRETLRIAGVRQRFGAVGELDVTQARALLRDTEALIPVLETGIRHSRNALSTLMGRPPEELAEVMRLSEGIPTPPVTIAVGAPVDLLRRRPDVRFAEFQAAAQSARIGIAQAAMRPRFSLLGSIGLASSTSASADPLSLFSLSSLTYFVGPRFSLPLFNYGRLRNNVRIQDARYQQLALNYQNTVLGAAREVEDALTAFLQAGVRGRLLEQSVSDASTAVETVLVQYRGGSVDYQRVLDAQRFLVQQQDRLTTTRGDVVVNLVAAHKALGGGWQIRQARRILGHEVEQEMRDRTNWGDVLLPSVPDELTPEEPRTNR